MSTWPANVFRCGRRWIDRLERGLLTVLVTGMVVVATLQIILRNVWRTGLPWAESLLGMALLWMTLLGALAASGLGRHLAIDLFAALVPRRVRAWTVRATSLFAMVVCVFLAHAAGRYVTFQQDMPVTELLGQPYWKYYQIIPLAFWLMSVRFLIRGVVPSAWLADGTDEEDQQPLGGPVV